MKNWIIAGILTLCASTALASGDMQISFTQPDCTHVDRWELEVDGAVWKEFSGVTCADSMTAVVVVEGVGDKTFRLRAYTAGDTDYYVSAWSNEVVAAVPLAKPVLVDVQWSP